MEEVQKWRLHVQKLITRQKQQNIFVVLSGIKLEKMNSYDLSRAWFDFAFDNPDKVKPVHTAIYFFAIEHCNRLGWKKKFGFPTSMVMEANGIKSYSSYKKHFDEIVSFGFFIVHEYSRNQYSSNVIALTLNAKAHIKADVKALDKALSKHTLKQHQSTVSINKPLNNKPLNNITIEQLREFNFSAFDNISIIQTWLDWITYKKEQFKDEYKSSQSHQIAIDKLSKLSGNSSSNAKTIIENSIANLYRGLFELKQNQNNNGNQNNNNTAPVNAKLTLSERMAEVKRRASERRNQQSNSEGSNVEPFSDFENVN